MLKAKREKKSRWKNKRARVKHKLLKGTKNRLVVYRSNRNIFAQIVDDNSHTTLVSVSSIDKDIDESIRSADSKIQQSELVGNALASKAKKKKITEVIFDRNGYKYHGRVKAFAEAARKGGLTF
ncbi:MAG: 50S ribosomal protein L18 [Candidatus Marinimicrobia bacterium]|nr:50S ribosomal protein L18 [Candidatus Neomarinimicrobiota bacterium]|tara:strand:- start:23 stop:394 length:372 start_codon:yes stop_codon:yes gene_type:complete